MADDAQPDSARPPQCPDCGQDIVVTACGRSRPATAAEVELLHEIAIGVHRKVAHDYDPEAT